MHYKLIISERAELHIDNILDYVVNTLNNPGAAKAILSDIEEAFKPGLHTFYRRNFQMILKYIQEHVCKEFCILPA